MLEKLQNFFQPKLASFDRPITREQLKQIGRLVMVDDEDKPLLLSEIETEGFSITHDKTGENLRHYDNQLYDVAIVDYHGVGGKLGPGQGLELIKYIRRVSPRTRVIAYTSKSLSAAESEFFTISHAVLPKDMSLVDSLSLIEKELQRAFSKEYLLDSLVNKLRNQDESFRRKIEAELVRALQKNDQERFKQFLLKVVGTAAEKGIEVIVSRLFV